MKLPHKHSKGASKLCPRNKKAYVHIEDWRNRPLQGGRYPYVYVDGIYLRRNWGGEYENGAILVAIAVNEDGFREVLGAAEGDEIGQGQLGQLLPVAPWMRPGRCKAHQIILCFAQIQDQNCS